MNFISFPVETTNIFPLANSSSGSQLLTEWNIRSINSVETDSTVKYFIGPSYAHSMDDFAVYSQLDGYDNTISSTTIQVQPGRALINGHFVQSLVPINIDLVDANYLAKKEGLATLKGKLAIGLRMAYSTYATLAESALIENKDDYFEGIQIVILPIKDVKLPKDVPAEEQYNKVNMHLLLGTFSFKNGTISKVTQNSEKIQSIEATRIGGLDDLLGDAFLTAAGLDPNKLYVYAGKSEDGSKTSGKSTWCDATDSEMVWDNTPKIGLVTPSKESYFRYNSKNGEVELVLAHKQVDGMKNTAGQSVYYQDKVVQLPAADFEAGTGGVVNAAYTSKIKYLREKVNSYYRYSNGHMRGYIAELNDRADLPTIPTTPKSVYSVTSEVWYTALNDVKVQIANLKTQMSELQTTITTSVNTQLSNFETTQDNKLTAFETREENYIQKQTADIKTDIDTIQSQIAQLQTDVSELQAKSTSDDKDDTKKRLAQLESDVKELQGNVKKLQNNMSTFQASVNSDVQSNNEKQNKAIADYQTNLDSEWDAYKVETTTKLDTQLEAINTTVNALEPALDKYVDAQIRALATKYNVSDEFEWRPGDFILVGQDFTVDATVEGRAPSTMYVVIAPYIKDITYLDEITTTIYIGDGKNNETYIKAKAKMKHTVPSQVCGGIEIESQEVTTDDVTEMKSSFNYTSMRGTVGVDYFVARRVETDKAGTNEIWHCYFFTPNITETQYSYPDEPIWITGGIPYATEDTIGGFVSVPEDTYGYGYVRIDENGRLRLVDYELLLTGVLSYQLGQDYSEGSGVSLDELQTILDENINNRVAYPNATQIQTATDENRDPYIIHLYLTLSDEEGTLNLENISSRYDTEVYLHIQGSATSNLTLNITKCSKLRIDSTIAGAPVINLTDVNLYYDSNVLDLIGSVSGLSLWYKKFDDSDPNIQVDGMTVTCLDDVESTDGIDPWSSNYANDNHYSYSIRSLTFADDGTIIKVGMLVGDSTTANIDEGKSVFASTFTLPQSSGLTYPASKMTHKIKITGTFVSHYYVQNDNEYMMKVTEFTAITQKYNTLTGENDTTGTISFLTDAFTVSDIVGVDAGTTVDGWDLNTPHYFEGGMIE